MCLSVVVRVQKSPCYYFHRRYISLLSMRIIPRNLVAFGLAACGVAALSASLRAQQSAAAASAPKTEDAALPAAHNPARKLKLEGLPNLGQVTSTLYRGGQPTKEGLEALARMGVGVVVDLREGTREAEQDEVTKLGMHYVAIPWRCSHPDDATVAKFLTLLRNNRDTKIFVHCYVGTDRTGMMIAAYRMSEQGWTPEEAKIEMQAYGFSFVHHLLCPGLSSYEEKFPSAFAADPEFQALRSSEQAAQPLPPPDPKP